MTDERLCRTAALLGEDAMRRLDAAHVLLLGLGGVGGHAFDALLRSGIGALTVVDFDTVCPSNMNRQLLATRETLGMKKTAAAALHAARITDRARLTVREERLTPDGVAALLDNARFDIILDAIDDVPVKVALAVAAKERGIALISCLGMGNRTDPTAITVTDIAKTDTCPLARALRVRLRKAGVDHLPVVFSREPSRPSCDPAVRVASVAYVPSAAGLTLAAEAIRILCGESIAP